MRPSAGPGDAARGTTMTAVGPDMPKGVDAREVGPCSVGGGECARESVVVVAVAIEIGESK